MIGREKLDEKSDEILKSLSEIELEVMSEGLKLSDAIRAGSRVTQKAETWCSADGNSVCALSAGVLAAHALGYI